MRIGTCWVKYALLAVTVLALATTMIPSGKSLGPMQACTPSAITISVTSVTTTVTSSTSSTQVAGLTAVSTLSSFQVTSTSTSDSCVDFGMPVVTPGNIATVFNFVTVVIVLGVPLTIPEFNFGLFVLVIFMVATYAYVKRRVTRAHDQS